jgi:hypothetical protein
MSNTITQTIVQFTNTETDVTRMVLRPQTLFLREQFQNQLENQINNSTTNRLPYLNRIETVQSIDSETIIELNNTTTSERRVLLMESIINYQNSSENRALLIENSSPQVRTYLHDLLIRSANNSNISEEDLYRVGNIFLYIISNLDIDGLVLRDVVQNLRESMVIHNNNQIYSILSTQVTSYNSYLDGVGLATEEQLEERVQEFHQEVDQRIVLNHRRVLYTGIGLLGSMVLGSIGMPPIGSLLVRSLTSDISNSPFNPSSEEIIRLRDIWDASLRKVLSILHK